MSWNNKPETNIYTGEEDHFWDWSSRYIITGSIIALWFWL